MVTSFFEIAEKKMSLTMNDVNPLYLLGGIKMTVFWSYKPQTNVGGKKNDNESLSTNIF